ncbi:LPXTG cell wall anchor domain-containing protein [Micromonospora chokoriensis]|uniref:LPXTG-motif cell wall anchor domain-containing protein n=1 Tax=Micromonospora chokoriensis TaxID=356851 RepID=A0A1C4V580_9ACTN|nr:LPXTG cell wall anchor domain-containing protein [Micromonospora chokoriensis]SCE79124.1 LPXTG-motif cell wall anchor domain-containing protein [Micromonospora chokoriensis]
MLNHSTRRWLAGLGVAGAFVAASAGPASAEEPSKEIFLYANNVLLAPGGEAKAVTLQAFTEALPRDFTISVDSTAVTDFATVSLTDDVTGCATRGPIITCSLKGAETIDYVLDLTVEAKDSAAVGKKGDVTLILAAEGMSPVTTTSTVEIGEGVDLKADEVLQVSGAPGASMKAPLRVANVGNKTTDGAVLLLSSTPGLTTSRHSNCSYLFAFGTNFAQCAIDRKIEPGEALQLDSSSTVKIASDAWAPGEQYGTGWWFADGDWAEFLAEFPVPADEWEKGTGAALTLVPAPGAQARRLQQTDEDSSNNATEIRATVTGSQGADAAATGAEVSGAAGKTVNAKVGFVNNGPAMINSYAPNELVTAAEITIPAGATVVAAPAQCTPSSNGEEVGGYGQPGARSYFCEWYDLLRKGDAAVFEFELRIDKVAGAPGTVRLWHYNLDGQGSTVADLDPKNDRAAFVIKGASGGNGGGQGGDDGGLPVTGQSTGLIAGIGALLLAAGVGGYLVAKRRRTRFVA